MINENSNSYKPFLYNVNIEQNYEQFVRSSIRAEDDYQYSGFKGIGNVSQQ